MRWALLVAVVGSLSACAPQIGDSCSSSVDCSVNGDRICDRAQPGGYCTVADCEMDTCPDDTLCVQFRSEPERLSSSWCMAPCEENGDCRDGYECRRAEDIKDSSCNQIAHVLDPSREESRFCAVPGNPPGC